MNLIRKAFALYPRFIERRMAALAARLRGEQIELEPCTPEEAMLDQMMYGTGYIDVTANPDGTPRLQHLRPRR